MKEFLKRKRIIVPLLLLSLSYILFIYLHETRAHSIAEEQMGDHAQILADDLWNYDQESAREYLTIAALHGSYEGISLLTSDNTIFISITESYIPSFYSKLRGVSVVPSVRLKSPVTFNSEAIGYLQADWVPQTLHIYLIILTLLILVFLIYLLVLKIVSEKELLEVRIQQRTEDLNQEKRRVESSNLNLQKTHAEVEALLDNSPIGIMSVDLNRIIQRVNSETSKITGYPADELIGRSTELLYPTKEIFEKHGKTNYRKLIKDGHCQAKSEIIRQDGTMLECFWIGRLISSESGPAGVIWSIEESSKKAQTEQELLKMRNLESIGILAGGIAHDFNNILVAILGNISMAERLVKENQELADLLNSAKKASLIAKDLTGKLLTFSSGGEPVKAASRLPELLKESALFVLSGSNVRCVFDIPDDIWPVSMDKVQISQVIQNLVVNADQAMAEGGTLHISCENLSLSPHNIPGAAGKDYVCIKVKDDGKGIDTEKINRIFDPFYSTKIKDANKGSGLGLSIVHSIITKHDGDIQVESEPGKGSTFTILLPAAQAQPVKREEIGEPLAIEGNGNILIMDDDETILEVVVQMLEKLGYTASIAHDGEEAFRLYERYYQTQTPFDAVILDLTIPGAMGGEETLQKLFTINPDIRAIVSSGYSQEFMMENYKRAGFHQMIAKPYQFHELSEVLSACLQKG